VELLQTIVSFLVALIILVAVHEFGHFYVARRCGVKVIRFSIGFGQVLWSRTDKKGTEYTLAALPLGGFVKMLDEREGEVPADERHMAFNHQSVWKRMAIVAAGPAANFILAIVLLWALLLGGERDLIPTIGKVLPGSVAAQLDLEPGQEILAVDGTPTPTWGALGRTLAGRLGETGPIDISVAYPDSTYVYHLKGQLKDWLKNEAEPDPIKGFGIELYLPIAPVVGEITKDSPAEKAGFQTGDKILLADQKKISDFSDWIKVIQSHPDKSINVQVERSGHMIELVVTPLVVMESGQPIGKIGMGNLAQPIEESRFRHVDHTLISAFVRAVDKTWDTSAFILLSIKKLIVGEISTKNLSGPVTIAKVAGSSAKGGIESFTYFLVMISISLAIFNLLPIPVLDGGHLFYCLIEVIRGKPVSDKVQNWGFQVGFVLIISLSLFALYNDVARL